jgi:cell fate (sporulation/competence/biofilm development) regulator YlbF (YheA/YmcA/DUF963 family)
MTVNVYDQANELESALRQSEEFNNMKELYAKVNSNEESKTLFEEFRAIQLDLQQKQMQGEELGEEDVMKAQKTAEDIEKDENIRALMDAEQKMSQLIQDLNRVIMKPIEELYGENN